MHIWGKPGVDWEGIDAAAEFIARWLLRAGVNVSQWKEKFGTVRVYCYFGLGYTDRVPDRIIDIVNKLIIPMQSAWYRQVYRQAIARWPHLSREIVCCADYPELLEGLYEPKSDPPESRGQ